MCFQLNGKAEVLKDKKILLMGYGEKNIIHVWMGILLLYSKVKRIEVTRNEEKLRLDLINCWRCCYLRSYLLTEIHISALPFLIFSERLDTFTSSGLFLYLNIQRKQSEERNHSPTELFTTPWICETCHSGDKRFSLNIYKENKALRKHISPNAQRKRSSFRFKSLNSKLSGDLIQFSLSLRSNMK